jgi:hypothetical protein
MEEEVTEIINPKGKAARNTPRNVNTVHTSPAACCITLRYVKFIELVLYAC